MCSPFSYTEPQRRARIYLSEESSVYARRDQKQKLLLLKRTSVAKPLGYITFGRRIPVVRKRASHAGG